MTSEGERTLPERTPWWASSVTRATLVFASFLLLATFTTGYLVYRGGRAELMRAASERMRHTIELGRLQVDEFVKGLLDDIALLADNEPVRGMVHAAEEGDTARYGFEHERLALLLESYLRSRVHVAQVRFIGADPHGTESIRFDRQGGAVLRVPDSLLQRKGDRDYYEVTMRLSSGETYLSPIDLNREHGQVQWPMVPTLRIAAPLVGPRGKRIGILIINAGLDGLFDGLRALQGSHSQLMLARADGELLLHPDTALMFRFDRGGSFTLRDVFGTSDTPQDTVIARGPDRVLVHEWTLPGPGLPYRLAVRVGTDALLAGLFRARDLGLVTTTAIVLFFLALTLLWSNAARERFDRIIRSVERYAHGERGTGLPVDRADEIGRLSRGLVHMQDRIDQRVQQLNEARHRAETADRVRRELIANMSHEVRTPLHAIMGMAQGIDRSMLSEADVERLDLLLRSALRLKSLVDDLLLQARMEEGRLPLHMAPVDLRLLLNDVMQSHREPAGNKGLALRLHMQQVPDAFVTDALRVQQILDNLVGNAIAHSHQGHVDLRASVQEGSPRTLRVEVRDQGPGIPDALRERVFERFEQGGAEGAGQGTGLGLAITRRLVEHLGGSIGLESIVGVGSTFTVSIPEGTATIALQRTAVPAPRKGLRVLHVEDAATNRMIMEEWAAAWGWDMLSAVSSSEALALSRDRSFDLMLIDLDLGGDMRGSELALRLRGLVRHRSTPMLAVTAYVDEDAEAELRKAGMNGRITKPIDRDELLRAVHFWTCPPMELPGPAPAIDVLEHQFDGEPQAVLRALHHYRREFATWRIELDKAVQDPDTARIAACRHKIRPHWLLLRLDGPLQALDALQGADPVVLAEVHSAFDRCERAFLDRQRELSATATPSA